MKKIVFTIVIICLFLGALVTTSFIASGRLSALITINKPKQNEADSLIDSVENQASNASEIEHSSDDAEIESTEEILLNTDDDLNTNGSTGKADRGGMQTKQHQIVTMGLYSFDIPLYWAYSEGDTKHAMYYDAFVDGTAQLQISSVYDSEDEVYYEWLVNPEEHDNLIESVAMWYDDFSLVSDELVEYEETKGMYLIGEFKDGNRMGTIYTYIFPSVENNNWVFVNVIEMDNCDFSYKNDFEQIISAIYKTE